MSLQTNARLSDCIRVDSVYDPLGDTDLTGVPIDMKDWDGCLVLILPTITTPDATHHITGFAVASNSASDGSGTDHDIVEAVTADAGTTKTLTAAELGTAAFTAVHNYLFALDVRADQLYAGDRYIVAKPTSTGTFGCVIVYIRYRGAYSYKDMIQATKSNYQYDGDLT